MTFVDHHQVVFGEIIQQTKGACSRISSVQIARVIFNTTAIPEFADHLQVKFCAFVQAFGFQVFPDFFEVGDLLDEVFLDLVDCILQDVRGGDKQVGRVDAQSFKLFHYLVVFHIKRFDFFNFVSEKMDAVGKCSIGRVDGDRVSLYFKSAAFDFCFCTGVQAADQGV